MKQDSDFRGEIQFNQIGCENKITASCLPAFDHFTDLIDLGQSNNLEIKLKENQTNRMKLWWTEHSFWSCIVLYSVLSQLWTLNWPVLDLILRVRDGRRVPDELEPGGRVGLQLQEVRGRGGSCKYFKYFNFYSALRHNTTARENIRNCFQIFENLIKIHKSLNLNIFSQSVFVYFYQPWILVPSHADSDILRVSTEEGKEVPFSFLETTKKL